MFEKNFESVIGIDTVRGAVHFYSMKNGNKSSIDYFVGSYKAEPFSDEFFEKLGGIITRYRESHPASSLQKVSVVLSDSTVLLDTINLPIINKRAMGNSIDAMLTNLYGGSGIKFNKAVAMQNKQFATYAIAGRRMDMLVKLQNALMNNQVGVGNVTFCSAAATNAAFVLNPKLKNASFILLDVKDDSARIVFVVKGKTMGFYSLPFGTNVIHKTLVNPESAIFDHSAAELLVLNAKEKARAKALTSADDDTLTLSADEKAEDDEEFADNRDDDDDDDEDDDEDDEVEVVSGSVRLRKKSVRKLPKYMQRPIPTKREGFIFENFRVFVKWTLELIANNGGITALGEPEAVYVNMPEEYSFLCDMINEEAEENGIKFMPLSGEQNELVRKNLDLYGGFTVKQYNKLNNFHSTQFDNIKSKASEKSAAAGKSAESVTKALKSVLAFIKKIATYEIGGKK